MTTDNVTISHKYKEVMLELEVHKEEPMTRDYPGAPAEFEILNAVDRDGNVLDEDTCEWIANHLEDQIWEALADQAEMSQEDYDLEKAEDAAYEAKWEHMRRKNGD